MTKGVRTRAIIILGVMLLAVYGIIGLPKSMDELRKNIAENIKLGLDLKGGTYLVLQVQVQDALKAEADRTMESLKEDLRKEGIDYAAMDRNDPTTIEEADSIHINIRGVPVDKTGALRSLIADRHPSWILTPVSSTDYRLNLRPTELIALKRDAVERTQQAIQNRIDGLGLTEPIVQQRGRADADSEILVQLPGVDDPARVKQIMQMEAMLEISEVRGTYPSQEAALAAHGGVLPLNTKLVRASSRSGEQGETWFLVSRTPVITGRDLRNARPGRDEFNKWETDFTLTKEGARRFARFTEANIGNRLAIILDGQVRSAPVIQSRIEDQGRITGAASQQEASDLALVLRAGSLPAGIKYEEERTVGPSLGADSIRQGITAGLVGLALVVGVMLVYYKGAGVNAVVALILNAILLLAIMAYFGAVLTLPGIAGVILTIGMAVDANILIFERIREELRAGKGVLAAVDTGFNRAFLTIIDTHVTTVVSCAFLFMFGTGPVKGFAVTLVIGLIANLFTAVFVSRTMFDWHLGRQRQVTRLSI
ncbi:MAG TPA: protein translocase subunit SecD [Bryobacteraceae bacterium]|nr:protein translocase subunit SecD [Bryobacteraceae bacterium]